MSDVLTTPRLALPLLAAGQAQKEITHNEALTLVDLAIAPLVETIAANAPPPSPAIGQQWIVGPAPTGAWTGQAGALAGWTGQGWRFLHLPPGATVTERPTMLQWQRNSITWVAPVAVTAPSGGATIDAECRAKLAALIAALSARGLLAA